MHTSTAEFPAAPLIETRRWLVPLMTVGGGLALITALVMQRDLLMSSGRQATRLSAVETALLVAAIVALRANAAMLHAVSTPGLAIRRAFQVGESQTAMTNTVVAGPGLALGLRVAMMRSWQVSGVAVATSCFATALAPTAAEWLIAGLYSAPQALFGHAGPMEFAVAVLAPGVLLCAAMFWGLVLRSESALNRVAWMIALGQRAIGRIGRRLGGNWATRQLRPVLAADPFEVARQAKAQVLGLGVKRWIALFAIAVTGQALLGGILGLCAVSISNHPVASVWTIVRLFAVYRLIAGFLPLPGGIGVIDVAMVSVLTSQGLSAPEAVATMTVFRALTFVVPMFSGAIAAALWRSNDSRRTT